MTSVRRVEAQEGTFLNDSKQPLRFEILPLNDRRRLIRTHRKIPRYLRARSCPPPDLQEDWTDDEAENQHMFIFDINMSKFRRTTLEALLKRLPLLNYEDPGFLQEPIQPELYTGYMAVIAKYVKVLEYGDRLWVEIQIKGHTREYPEKLLLKGVRSSDITSTWRVLSDASTRLQEIQDTCPARYLVQFHEIRLNRIAKYRPDHPIVVFLLEFLRTSRLRPAELPSVLSDAQVVTELSPVQSHFSSQVLPWEVPVGPMVQRRLAELLGQRHDVTTTRL